MSAIETIKKGLPYGFTILSANLFCIFFVYFLYIFTYQDIDAMRVRPNALWELLGVDFDEVILSETPYSDLMCS